MVVRDTWHRGGPLYIYMSSDISSGAIRSFRGTMQEQLWIINYHNSMWGHSVTVDNCFDRGCHPHGQYWVSYDLLRALQLIWVNLPDLQMGCSDLWTWEGTRIAVTSMATRSYTVGSLKFRHSQLDITIMRQYVWCLHDTKSMTKSIIIDVTLYSILYIIRQYSLCEIYSHDINPLTIIDIGLCIQVHNWY